MENRETDKNLENLIEESFKGLWKIISFSVKPVQSHTGVLFENLIRSLTFYILLSLGFCLFCLIKDHTFNLWYLLYFFYCLIICFFHKTIFISKSKRQFLIIKKSLLRI